MHFEILVEDQSGKKMLEILIPKILDNDHTFRVTSYKGVGRLPQNIKSAKEVHNRMLLNNLPKLLKGYGNTYSSVSDKAAVIVVCDLDDKCQKRFLKELNDILDSCTHKPLSKFCLAIEEGEAWLLGDLKAVNTAYPKSKKRILCKYKNDSICGTWELLADAVYNGGSEKLKKLGWIFIGQEKSKWAEKITPHIEVKNNLSPSFKYFLNTLKSFI